MPCASPERSLWQRTQACPTFQSYVPGHFSSSSIPFKSEIGGAFLSKRHQTLEVLAYKV
jgi:hypothetical protein